ncbi:unnamed protein product [Acanthosepion pharaonis]|uniref:Myb-like domain-containing protein n=1 Tax=Acanthosepion pharaonis TaxID=158019 RepID=A0A812EKT6_ACAPH|nr:unnamed protein product [Sepia pharaonis]
MKPPSRKRKITNRGKDLHMEEYSRWTLSERQRLLKALEKYSPQQSSEIAKMVSTKSEADVIYYLSKLKRSLKFNTVAADTSLQRKYLKNIETWIRFTHRLVDDDEETYTTMIGKLLALYGEYCFKKNDPKTGVNFKSIYDYLAALMLGVQLPVLAPLEAALILDLLKNVASFLAQSDITLHKKFVLFNYKKYMYPNLASSGENEQSILKKLLHEALPPPCSTPSSSSSQPVEMIPTNFQREYEENILSDGTKATIVHLRRINTRSKQTKSDTNIQELDFSKSSLISEKIPAACMNKTPKNSSGTKQPTSNMSAPASAEVSNNSSSDQVPSQTKVLLLSNANTLLSFPSGGTVLQVPSGDTVLHLPKGGTITKGQDSTSVSQLSSGSTIQQGPDSANLSDEPNDSSVSQDPSRDTIQKRSILLQDPSGHCVQQQIGHTNALQRMNNTLVSQDPNGGTVQKRPIISSVLQDPNGGTVQQGASNIKVFQVAKKRLVEQGSRDASLLKEPRGNIIQKDVSNVKVIQIPSRLPKQLSSGATALRGSIPLSLFFSPSSLFPFSPLFFFSFFSLSHSFSHSFLLAFLSHYFSLPYLPVTGIVITIPRGPFKGCLLRKACNNFNTLTLRFPLLTFSYYSLSSLTLTTFLFLIPFSFYFFYLTLPFFYSFLLFSFLSFTFLFIPFSFLIIFSFLFP